MGLHKLFNNIWFSVSQDWRGSGTIPYSSRGYFRCSFDFCYDNRAQTNSAGFFREFHVSSGFGFFSKILKNYGIWSAWKWYPQWGGAGFFFGKSRQISLSEVSEWYIPPIIPLMSFFGRVKMAQNICPRKNDRKMPRPNALLRGVKFGFDQNFIYRIHGIDPVEDSWHAHTAHWPWYVRSNRICLGTLKIPPYFPLWTHFSAASRRFWPRRSTATNPTVLVGCPLITFPLYFVQSRSVALFSCGSNS